MAKTLVLFLAMAAAAFSQTARFPGSIVTDQYLKIAKDRAQTTLNASLNASATSFTVVSGAKFAANIIVTIDNEQISVCGVSGGTFTVGHTSCPNIDGRGFNGTSAASHASGVLVSAYMTAWNYTSQNAEIKAIETALGVNLANIAAATSYNASVYDFSAQSPGGTLSAGSNSITLTPCPVGVNGSDVGHSLYITGGTGTAEAVPITGGTCTSGAATGTVSVTIAACGGGTCHSGAWTIKSATSGLAEAQQAIASSSVHGGTVQINSNATVHAAVKGIAGTSIRFHGQTEISPQVTRAADYPNGDLFYNNTGATWTFADIFLVNSTGAAETGAAIHQVLGYLTVRDVQVYDGQYGIKCEGCLGRIEGFYYLQLEYFSKPVAAIWLGKDPGSTAKAGNVSISNAFVSATLMTNANVVHGALWLQGSDTVTVSGGCLCGGDYGLVIDNGVATAYNVNFAMSGTVIIDVAQSGIFTAGVAAYCSNFSFSGVMVQGDNNGTNTGTGVSHGIDWGYLNPSTCDSMTWVGGAITGFYFSGIGYAGTHTGVVFSGARVFDNNQANSAGQSGALVAVGATGFSFDGNTFYNNTGHQNYGIYLLGAATGSITSNKASGTVGGLAFGGALTGVVANNAGFNDGITYAALAAIAAFLPNGTHVYATDANTGCSAGASAGQDCVKTAGGLTH